MHQNSHSFRSTNALASTLVLSYRGYSQDTVLAVPSLTHDVRCLALCLATSGLVKAGGIVSEGLRSIETSVNNKLKLKLKFEMDSDH